MEDNGRATRVSRVLNYGDRSRDSYKSAPYEAASEAKSPDEDEQPVNEEGEDGADGDDAVTPSA